MQEILEVNVNTDAILQHNEEKTTVSSKVGGSKHPELLPLSKL